MRQGHQGNQDWKQGWDVGLQCRWEMAEQSDSWKHAYTCRYCIPLRFFVFVFKFQAQKQKLYNLAQISIAWHKENNGQDWTRQRPQFKVENSVDCGKTASPSILLPEMIDAQPRSRSCDLPWPIPLRTPLPLGYRWLSIIYTQNSDRFFSHLLWATSIYVLTRL